LDTHKFYSDNLTDKSEYIETLSPFILIGPKDTPDPSDVDAVCAYLAQKNRSLDFIAALIAEKENPNPKVRVATARILGNAWSMADEASAALEQMANADSEVAVSAAAKTALIELKTLVEKHRPEAAPLD
jgi:hypothetical protein